MLRLAAQGRPPTICAEGGRRPVLAGMGKPHMKHRHASVDSPLRPRCLVLIRAASLDSVLDSVQEVLPEDGLTLGEILGAESGKTTVDQQEKLGWLPSSRLQAILLLNLGSAMFGSNQVAMKMAETSVDPNTISALRFLFAAACFLPGIVRGLQMPRLREAGLELGLWLFAGYALQAIGLESTTAGHGAFTGTLVVIVVPLLCGLSGRRVPWQTWAAAAVALAGVGLLTTSNAQPNTGDALCLTSALFFGVQKWRSEGMTMRFAAHTQELVAVQLATLAGAAAIFEAPGLLRTLASHSPDELAAMAGGLPWPLLAYMGIATTGFTLWIEINALKDVSAPLAALIYTSEPLWGALFAWQLLGERWGPTGWLGAALIVLSCLGSQIGGRSSDTEKPRVPTEQAEGATHEM